LKAACENTCAELRRWNPDRRVEFQLGNGLPLAAVPQIQLEQVLRNLVSNADKYSPPQNSIRILASETEGMIRVSVADSGPGIPWTDKEKIFSRGYRLGQHKNQPGIGLGLPTCKALVEGWSGQIWYEPGMKAGSMFCFTIPTYAENAAATERNSDLGDMIKVPSLA
jgi:K+-sensing histidine kinase KdpD